MLWTFRDGSFVPHEVLASAADGAGRPGPAELRPAARRRARRHHQPGRGRARAFLAEAKRVVEIIDGDEGRRQAGRARYRAYRERGVQPASHNL